MLTQPDSDWLTDLDHEEGERVEAQQALDQVVPGVTTGNLLKAMEDPSVFPEIARGDLYIQMALLRQHAGSRAFSPTQRMEYAKFLARMGKVESPEKDVTPYATAPLIQINFSGGHKVALGAAGPKGITIDHEEVADA